MTNTSVLIVDADAPFVNATQTALEAYGVTVYVREDLPLDLLVRMQPDILLLSADLPDGQDVLTLCGKIRRTKELKSTKILLTGSESSAQAFQAHARSAHAADAYAVKPLPTEALLERVAKLFEAIQQAPPPMPGASMAPPPTLPPPLPSAGGGPPPLKRAAAPSDGPPALKRSLPAPPPMPGPKERSAAPAAAPAPQTADTWKAQSFDEMIRDRQTVAAPQASLNASPDEKLRFLREQNKFLESKVGIAKGAWDELLTVMRDFEHVATSQKSDLARRDTIIKDLEGELERVEKELNETKLQYERFQAEIDAIFHEKQAEQDALHAEVETLRAGAAAMEAELAELRDRGRDDGQRLSILKEDVISLEAENDELKRSLSETSARVESLEQTLEATRTKLDMTSSVAEQRGQEIDTLLEKLDRLAIDARQEQEQLNHDREAAIEELQTQHALDMEAAHDAKATLEALLREELSQLETRYSEEATDREARHQRELAALGQALDDAEQRIRSLEQLLEGKTGEMTALSRQESETKSRIAALEEERDDLLAQLSEETQAFDARIHAAREEKVALESRLLELTGFSEQLKAQVEALELELENRAQGYQEDVAALEADLEARRESERRALSSQLEAELGRLERIEHEKNRLERELESTREAFRTKSDTLEGYRKETELRLRALEEDVERANEELFETSAERDHLRHTAQDLETNRIALERELARFREERESLEDEVARLSEDKSRLGTQLAALAEEREAAEDAKQQVFRELAEAKKRSQRAESVVEESKDQISRLETTAQEAARLGRELAEERSQRAGVEAKLAQLSQLLERQDHGTKESQRRVQQLEKELQEAKRSGVSNSSELEAKDQRIDELETDTEEMFAQNEDLRSKNRALEAQATALAREKAELAARLAQLESSHRAQVEKLEAEAKRAGETRGKGAKSPVSAAPPPATPKRSAARSPEKAAAPAVGRRAPAAKRTAPPPAAVDPKQSELHARIAEEMARAERIAAEAAEADHGYEAPEDERGVTDSIEEAFDLVMGTPESATMIQADEGPTADGKGGDYVDPFEGMMADLDEDETGQGQRRANSLAAAGFGDHEATIGADSAIEDAFGAPAVLFGVEAEDTLNLDGDREIEEARASLRRRASVAAEKPPQRPSKASAAAARKKLRALTQPNGRDAGGFDQAAEALLGALDPVGWDPASDPFRDPRAGLPSEQAPPSLGIGFESEGETDRQVTEILNLERLKK